MKKISICLLICIICTFVNEVYGAGTGLIHIGNLTDEEGTQLYSFNENEKEGTIPVILLNSTLGFDGGNPSVIVNVVVSCFLEPSADGYSEADFESKSVITNQLPHSNTVQFSGMVVGRITDIYCYGDSADGSDQFTRETSTSQPQKFEIRPSAKVYICTDMTIPDNANNYRFYVDFSEEVQDNEIIVSCQSSPTDSLNIIVPDKIVSVGSSNVEMSYTMSGSGESTTVSCSAQSQNGGVQFISENSTGNQAMFTVGEATVDLVPKEAIIYAYGLKIYLVLDAKPESDTTVEFFCRSDVGNTTEDVNEMLLNPACLSYKDVTESPPTALTSESSETTVVTVPLTSDYTDVTPNTNANETVTMSTTEEETTDYSSLLISGSTREITSVTSRDTQETTRPTISAPDVTQQPDTDSDVVLQPGFWYLVDGPDFTVTSKTTTLTLRRSRDVDESKMERVVVTCCVKDEQINTKYINMTTGMSTAAYMMPNKVTAYNTTEADLQVEREIINPAYVEVAPCPCDLTTGACDVDCCCDEDCTADDVAVFTCIPGEAGGQGAEDEPSRSCSADFFKQPGWFPLMCVEIENNAFLGYYWFVEPAIRTQEEYSTKRDSVDIDYSYNSDEVKSGTPTQYTMDSSVATGLRKKANTNDYHIGSNYRLTLPQPVWSGQCVWTAPVQYLIDSSSVCPQYMTEDLCTEKSPLNAQLYAQSSRWSDPCRGPVVMARGNQKIVTNTDVNYLCADAEQANQYIRSTQTINDVMPPNEVKLFGEPHDNYNLTGCVFDPMLLTYVCPDQEFVDTSPTPPSRCNESMIDDGYTKPPVPELIGGVCHNAVVDMLYNFTWSGSTILLLNATVVLGDIPIQQVTPDGTTENSVLTQRFQSTFIHFYEPLEVNDTSSENDTETLKPEGQYSRSGNPVSPNSSHLPPLQIENCCINLQLVVDEDDNGYEFGHLLISGQAEYNITDDDNSTTTFAPDILGNLTSEENVSYIDVNSSSQLSLWKTGVDSLCDGAGRDYVMFGQDASSSCILRLDLPAITDCVNLRKLVLNRQDSMMASTHLSLVGDPDRLAVSTDWVHIIREDISHIITGTLPEEDFTTVDPTTLPPTTYPGFEILPGYSYLATTPGLCEDVPHGIHIDVMYAQTGMADYAPIYNIVGSKISYTLSTWRLYCVGADGLSCYSNDSWITEQLTNSSLVQSFPISTSVNFIRVPAKTPKPKTKYEEDHARPVDYCAKDSCWDDLGYPWQRSFKGDPHGYVIGFSLVWVVILAGTVAITKPWW